MTDDSGSETWILMAALTPNKTIWLHDFGLGMKIFCPMRSLLQFTVGFASVIDLEVTMIFSSRYFFTITSRRSPA